MSLPNVTPLFSGGGRFKILPWQIGDDPISSNTSWTYKVDLRPTNDPDGPPLEAHFTNAPNRMPGDGELDIRIVSDQCLIVLQADGNSSYDFEFIHATEDALTLQSDPTTTKRRYFNFQAAPLVNGRCKTVSFNANKYNVEGTNDEYNLCVLVYFRAPDGSPVDPPLVIRMDPEIKNPGDNGLVVLGGQ